MIMKLSSLVESKEHTRGAGDARALNRAESNRDSALHTTDRAPGIRVAVALCRARASKGHANQINQRAISCKEMSLRLGRYQQDHAGKN